MVVRVKVAFESGKNITRMNTIKQFPLRVQHDTVRRTVFGVPYDGMAPVCVGFYAVELPSTFRCEIEQSQRKAGAPSRYRLLCYASASIVRGDT